MPKLNHSDLPSFIQKNARRYSLMVYAPHTSLTLRHTVCYLISIGGYKSALMGDIINSVSAHIYVRMNSEKQNIKPVCGQT